MGYSEVRMARILVVVLAVACCCAVSAAEVLVADLNESELSDPLADTATPHSHRQKEAVRKALRQDKDGAVEDMATTIDKREQRTDAAALYDAAQGEIAAGSKPDHNKMQTKAHETMRQGALEAQEASDNMETEHAIEALEAHAVTSASDDKAAIAGAKPEQVLGSTAADSKDSASGDEEESLEQLPQQAAAAEKDSSVAQADAEAAHLDKMAADQKVARIAASKLAAETALEDSETAHLESVKKAARATRVKQTAEEVAALASSRADAAAKVLEDHAAAKLQQERDLQQMLSKKAAEHRQEKAAAMKKAEQKLHEASIKAHETELAARLRAVTQESDAQLSRARRHAAMQVETAQHVEDAKLDAVKSGVAHRIEAAKHKELVQQMIKEELKQAKLQTAQATLITPAPAPVKLSSPTPAPAPLSPDEVIARLENKVDQLADVAERSSQSAHEVSVQELSNMVAAQGGKPGAPVDLDEESLSRTHTKLESQVHEAAYSSKEEQRAEEAAERAEAHFRHIENKP